MRGPDDAVRSTDLDALSCRVACCNKGYLQDTYLPRIASGLLKFQPLFSSPNAQFVITRNLKKQLAQTKLPIINRGTYIRVKAIDTLIARFLEEHKGEACQIVSLGAGSDTRPFALLPEHKLLSYVELDFEQSVKVKKCSILSDEGLSGQVGAAISTVPVNYDEFSQFDSELHTERYHLFSFDLRHVDGPRTHEYLSERGVNFDLPTLLLSECVLCYLDPEDSQKVLRFFKDSLAQASVVVYEPMGGEAQSERFGQVMETNLASRGISIPSLFTFGTLEKQRSRFAELGAGKVEAFSMDRVFEEWTAPEEIRRISRLELLDETEEWVLLSSHYCLVYCTW